MMNIALSNIKRKSLSLQNLAEAPEKIRELAREASAASPIEVELLLDENRYNLSAPVVFSAEEMPELAFVRLTMRGISCKKPAITAQRYFYNDKFEAVEGKPYYKYQLPQNEDGSYPVFREMYVDGKRVLPAKSEAMIYPFLVPKVLEKEEDCHEGMFLPIEVVERFVTEDTECTELQLNLEWEHKIFRICGVDFSQTREKDGKTYVLVKMGDEFRTFAEKRATYLITNGRKCSIWNSPAFLAPGSFTYNHKTGVLFFYPAEGFDIVHHTHEYPILENLLIFEGMEGLTLENISFKGITSGYASQNGYLAGQSGVVGNGTYRSRITHAAVYTRNMKRFTVRKCAFTEMGGYGLLMLDRSVAVRIEDCHFESIGMSAICIGNPVSPITKSWPEPENQTINLTVTNNYICHVGYEYPASCAFYVALVDVLEFTHNTVKDVPYSALSAGWNWRQVPYYLGESVNVRDAEIAFNYFEDYMTVLEDGGATYVNGGNCNPEDARLINSIHDNYAVCHEKRSRARYGYYMDGAASNWDCYHNVVINANHPIFAQPHPQSTSHHVHCHDIYSNTPYGEGMFYTERDNLVWDYHDKAKTEEELLAMYPAAVEIKKNAGVKQA